MFPKNTSNGVMNTMILHEQCLLITTRQHRLSALMPATRRSLPRIRAILYFAREYSGNAKQPAHTRGRLVLSNGLSLLFSLG
jgi:hypothetical protein